MKTTFVILCVLVAPFPAFADQYLCIPDKVTGFAYDKKFKNWDFAQFRATEKFIISSSEDTQYPFSWIQVGRSSVDRKYCLDDFDRFGVLVCNTGPGDLRFNKNNGRYIKTYEDAYYSVGPEFINKIDH